MNAWRSAYGYGFSTPSSRPETDDELRRRLLYVGGDGEAATRQIALAMGIKLDEIAETLNLRLNV